MNQVLQITDPGWDWLPLVISGGSTLAVFSLAGTLWVLSILSYNKRRWGRYSDGLEVAAEVVLGIAVIGAILGNGITAISTQQAYQHRISDAKVQGLSDMGYENIDLDLDKFTASVYGEYFSGSLVSSGDLKWEVVKLNAK